MKLKKIIIIVSILIFSVFFIGELKCYAATGSYSISKSSVSLKKGKSTAVTLSVKNCMGAFSVKSSDTTIATASISGDGWTEGSSLTITINAKKKGTATITVTPIQVGLTDTGEEITSTLKAKTIKVSVTEKTSSSNSTNSNDTSKNEPSKPNNTTSKEPTKPDNTIENKVSTDATLKNLGITPTKYDFTGFKKATTSYEITVPYEAEKISIYADTTNSKAKVTGIGSKTLEVGLNTFLVKVTAEDKKTTKTYTLNVTRKKEEAISKDATLKNLGITPKQHDFSGFRKMTTSYEIKVPYEAEKIDIYADSNDSKATVTGIGTKTLEVGLNTFSVKVTAEDKKTTKTYTLKITREEEKEQETEEETNIIPEDEVEENLIEDEIQEEVVGLTNLKIEGIELEPAFSNDIYEYNITTNSTEVLDIKTERSSEDITMDIVGNKNLNVGENVITLLVYNRKKDETTTYQIIATIEDEVELTEENNSNMQKQQSVAKKCIVIGFLIVIVMLTFAFIVHRNKILSRNEFLENNDKIDLSEDETMFEKINRNTEISRKKTKKKKGNHFK